MKVGIEGKVLARQIGGSGRYAINLLHALRDCIAAEDADVQLVIFSAPQSSQEILDTLQIPVCRRFEKVRSSLIRSTFCLARGVVSEHIDVFHGLDQSGIPFFSKKGKYVITIHDILPLVLPQAFPLKHRLVTMIGLSRVRRQADRVLVPSTTVKRDVMARLRVPEERIVVVPLGCEPRFSPSGDPRLFDEVRRRYGLPERYILFVGTLEPRKGIHTLLQAFAMIRAGDTYGDLKLVVTGGWGWGSERVRATVESLKLHHDVIFTGFTDEADLPHLYRGALLFVYPSMNEGFGLPVLEAMACGVPVITSNVSSMPEVAGQAAVLVEPNQPEVLRAAMASVLGDEGLRRQLREQGLARAQSFSWQDVARRTLDLYTDLL